MTSKDIGINQGNTKYSCLMQIEANSSTRICVKA